MVGGTLHQRGWVIRLVGTVHMYGKSRSLCTTDLSIPLLTPLELRKVQLITL